MRPSIQDCSKMEIADSKLYMLINFCRSIPLQEGRVPQDHRYRRPNQRLLEAELVITIRPRAIAWNTYLFVPHDKVNRLLYEDRTFPLKPWEVFPDVIRESLFGDTTFIGGLSIIVEGKGFEVGEVGDDMILEPFPFDDPETLHEVVRTFRVWWEAYLQRQVVDWGKTGFEEPLNSSPIIELNLVGIGGVASPLFVGPIESFRSRVGILCCDEQGPKRRAIL